MSYLRKISILSCSFLLGTTAVVADEHMENSDKLNEGLLFHATFDNTLKAERAAGEAMLQAVGPAAKRFGSGISNQGMRIGVNDKNEKFYAVLNPRGNIDPKQGTISFWVKPEDWDGKSKNFNLFVSGAQKSNNFYIYKYGAPTWGFCTINSGKAVFKPVSSAKWEKGKWQHVAVVWSKDYHRVYLNGAPVVTEGRNMAQDPMTAVYIGSRLWGGEKGTSIIDELKIFNRPLSQADVTAEYNRFGKKSSSDKTVFTIGKSPVKVDGEIGDNEYGFAGTGFVYIPDGYASEQTSYAVSHDDKYIYVAIQARLPRAIKADVTVRDGGVWADDSVEVWLAHPSKKLYQFICNTKGVLYDAMPLEKIGANWNIKDYKVACSVKDKLWTMEIALNKAELGGGDTWGLNLGRTTFVGEKPVPTSMMPVRTHLGYSDRERYAELKLRDSAPVFRIKSLGNINNGELDLLIETSCKVQVGNRTAALSNYQEEFEPQNGRIVSRQKLTPGGRLEIAADGVFNHSYLSKKLSAVAIQYIFVDKEHKNLEVAVKNEGGENGGKLTLKLKNRDSGKDYGKTVTVKGDNFFWNEKINVAAIPPGDYDFAGSYTDVSGTTYPAFLQIVRKPGEVNAWDNNNIGIYPGEIPPPWQPLAVENQAVKSLIQTYKWNNSIFPVSMIANGHEILAAPMELIINGRKLLNVTSKCVKQSAEKVEFVSTGTLNGINVRCDITVEFDGMVWVKMSVNGRNQVVKSMICQIPLKPQFASQVHSCEIDKHVGNPAIAYTGLLRNNHWQKNLYNRPAFWVGNDDAGVAWFAENLINWVNSDRNKSAEVIGGKDKAVVKLTMIDKPVRLNGSRKYEFGFQMTPVKTYDATPRTARLGVDWGWGASAKYFDYLDPRDEYFDRAHHNSRRNPVVARKGRYFLYIASNGASPYAPEWAWFANNWTSNKIGDYYVELAQKSLEERNRDTWTYACLNSKSFREFKLWQLNNLVNDQSLGIADIYYDLVGPRLCANTEHGCGWRDDSGNLRPTLNIKGGRDFHKRVYSLMKKRHPEGMHYYHVTGQPALPVLSAFCNALVEGESWYNNHLPEKETYFGAVDPNGFRTAYSGRKWGYQLIFIPQLERAAMMVRPVRRKLWNMPNPPAAMDLANRHIAGYFLTHDVMVWGGGFSFYTLYNRVWQKQQQFFQPWDNKVEFIGYWEQNKPFSVKSTSPDRVLVSAYTKGAKAMVAVVNDTDKAQRVEVTYPGKTSIDVFEGTAPALQNGSFKFEIQPQNFNLFYLQ